MKFLRQMERIKNYMSFYCAGGDIFNEPNLFKNVFSEDYSARKYAIDIMITFINEDLGGGLSEALKMLVYDAKCFMNGGRITCTVHKEGASKYSTVEICSSAEFYDNIPYLINGDLSLNSFDYPIIGTF